MVFPNTFADLLIWTIVAVLLVVDWYLGGIAHTTALRIGRKDASVDSEKTNPAGRRAA